MFYVPVLFNSLGSSRKTSLVQTIIVGAVNVLATFLAIGLVDKLGRRALFISGGILMIVAQVITGIVLGVEFGKYGQTLPDAVVIGVLITICAFIIGFAASWGPLGWLYPSEIHALETRPAAFSLAVLFNFLLSFVIGA
jgi:MFS transporter, SP family, sugar:H+ symporter